MSRVIIEATFYLTFAWALMVVCYGNRDTDHFHMTDGLEKVFHNKVSPFRHYSIVSESLAQVVRDSY